MRFRPTRTHLLTGAVLSLLLAGTALAVGGDPPESGEQVSNTLVDRLVQRLADAGIETDADALRALIPGHGVGGAVRILAWADAAGMDPADVAALFDDGTGWGQIRAQLLADNPDLELGAGIGWILGGGGGAGHGNAFGHDQAPGQDGD